MAIDSEFEQQSRAHMEATRSIEIAKVVRSLRKEKKWSQATLAKRSQVHRNTISRLERNPSMVTLKALGRVGAALGIPDWKILRCVDQIKMAA